MKELLYLKDEQLKGFVEKLFMGYRETFADAKKILDKHSIGIAHHKVIHLLSIYEGIENSRIEYVMWLDADGSMPVDDMLNLVRTQKENLDDVIIGSRFVEDGGYKGVKDLSKNKFIQAIKSVRDSNDSVLGMIFSIMFNRVLNF